ncbi:MAG: 50S ribosome-binding GTPase [Rhodanobacteraceae bacterium]|nr:50S ribosome-binding GTPase [Rhodanobacteraceae bacterium]
MPAASPTKRIRLLLAAITVASVLGLILSAIYATDAVLSIIERLQRLPPWLGVLTATLVSALMASTGWLMWRLLHPRARQAGPAIADTVDRATVEARLATPALQAATAPLRAELAELDRRAALEQIFVALFGDVSAGKSSLVRALVPGSEVRVDVRAGTTRSVQHYEGRLPDGSRLTLADVPGTSEWQGESRAVAAREEALRAHVVAYVCDGDLTRTQAEEIAWLREFGKPLLLLLNKTDRYRASELAAIRARLRERTGLTPLAISAGGVETVVLRAADGSEQASERQRAPQLAPLIDALEDIAGRGPAAYEAARERAVLGALDLKIGTIEADERARLAAALVREYARKAALGALAAVAPGTDLVIQGVLATRLLSELTQLYGVPMRTIDLDRFVELAGGRLRGSTALILAIVGNAMKAFPGLGTVGGGLVHAVAYAMIFDSLGRAVAETLARGEGFDRKIALERLDAQLSDRNRLMDLAPQMLKLALESRAEEAVERK